MSLDKLTHDTFVNLVCQTFQLDYGSGQLEARLSEIKPFGAEKEGTRRPFSLTFETDRSVFLPQKIYALTHPDLGTLDLFLVPVGTADERYLYEAIFA